MEIVKLFLAFFYRNRFFIEMIFASILFTTNVKKKKRWYIYGTIVILVCLIINTFWNYDNQNNIVTIIRYLILFFAIGLFLFLVYEINIYQVMFYTAGAMSCQHLSSILYHYIPAPYYQTNYTLVFLFLFCQISILIVVYLVLYFIFIKKIKTYPVKKNLIILFLNIVILMTDIVLSVLTTKNIYINIYDFLLTFVAFFYMFFALRHDEIENEKMIQETILIKEKKEFETLQNSIKNINIKCHDLKHILSTENNSYINDLKQEINIYDSYIKTGNDTLDIVLMDKKFQCESKNIVFSIMADAKDLSFMKQNDIYSLFGNMLDNAIEYLINKNDNQKIMNLNIKRVNKFFIIRCENYFDDELIFVNGLPETKKDKNIHGFGMKSIKTIIDKYNGSMIIDKENEMFVLNITFYLN